MIAFLTTIFKRLDISGWEETGCFAQARSRPVRDAQHLTDGFWAIDLRLEAFRIGQTPADLTSPRFLLIEVEPQTDAHQVCTANRFTANTGLDFGGGVVIDTDGPFLEIHPEEIFRLVPPSA